MPLQVADQPARGRVPEADQALPSRRGELTAVGAEGQAVDRALVPRQDATLASPVGRADLIERSMPPEARSRPSAL